MSADVGLGYAYSHDWRTVVAASIDDAFAFLADPRNVPLLEPPWTDLRFVSGPSRDFGLGSEREYIYRWWGWPAYLRIRVAEFDPPTRLALEQALGPWQSYRRAFTLCRVDAGTEIAEHDDFSAGRGMIQHVMHRLVVARQLRSVAAFRHEALLRHLGVPVSLVGSAPATARG